jgi:hypothetical protein
MAGVQRMALPGNSLLGIEIQVKSRHSVSLGFAVPARWRLELKQGDLLRVSR